MSRLNRPLEQFVAYRVTLAPATNAAALPQIAVEHPAIHALIAGHRSIPLQPLEAAAVYDDTDRLSRAVGETFPLQFTPVRRRGGRALAFERSALSAAE